ETVVFRRNGRWAEPPADWGRDPLADTESDELTTALGHCVDALPDSQRAVFLSSQVDGLNTEQTSTRHGITSNHLHVLMHRARLRLRRCLERTGLVKGGRS